MRGSCGARRRETVARAQRTDSANHSSSAPGTARGARTDVGRVRLTCCRARPKPTPGSVVALHPRGTAESIMTVKKDLEDAITPPETYFNRRTFLRGGVLAASVVTTGYAYRKLNGRSQATVDTRAIDGISASPDASASGFRVDEPTTHRTPSAMLRPAATTPPARPARSRRPSRGTCAGPHTPFRP